MFKIKKTFLNCAVVILAGSSMMCIASQSIPTEVEKFIPAGTRLIEYQTADLNLDSKEDALIVVEKINGSDASADEPRTVIILLRKNNDQLVIAEQNNRIYFCKKCLGSGNVNEQVLTASKGTFSVYNQGGSPGFRWTREYTFQYIVKDKTWQLYKVKTGIFDTSNNERFKTKELTYPKQLKKIKFAQQTINKKWNATF